MLCRINFYNIYNWKLDRIEPRISQIEHIHSRGLFRLRRANYSIYATAFKSTVLHFWVVAIQPNYFEIRLQIDLQMRMWKWKLWRWTKIKLKNKNDIRKTQLLNFRKNQWKRTLSNPRQKPWKKRHPNCCCLSSADFFCSHTHTSYAHAHTHTVIYLYPFFHIYLYTVIHINKEAWMQNTIESRIFKYTMFSMSIFVAWIVYNFKVASYIR